MDKKRHNQIDLSTTEPSLKKQTKPNINPWNKKPYSKKYYELLEKR